MTEFAKKLIVVAAIYLTILAAAGTQAGAAEPQSWPLEFRNNGVTLVLYPPQVDQWTEYRQLSGRMAVTITSPAAPQPTVGAIWFEGRTVTDPAARLVTFSEVKITKSKFPALDTAAAQQMETLVQHLMPREGLVIAMDRLLPQMESGVAPAQGVKVNLDPPLIFVSTKPAILLLIDGQPVWTDIQGTDLAYAVNASWDLFLNKPTSRHYLLAHGKWLSAPGLNDAWQPARELPGSFKQIPAEDNWNLVRQQVAKGQKHGFAPPRVFVSQMPAELIVFAGDPKFKSIEGTFLYYADNTESPVFFYATDQSYYLLLTGRWFKGKTLNGPWAAVTGELPADFARIPENNPKSGVLAAVPGTAAAEQAAIMTQIPQMARVKRWGAKAQAVYDGDPQFAPIAGTSLAYAVNTPNDVIQVGNRYYMCYQGVWFVSDSPLGPWVVADAVAPEIYTIPPSSPVYPATYVKVYASKADEVLVGFLAGYMGAYLATTGTVVYGTGYYYSPYMYGPVYYPPRAYTYGTAMMYNPYIASYVPVYGGAVYGPYSGVGGAAYYNPATGAYVRGGAAYGPYGAAGYVSAYNPVTGAYAYGATTTGPYGRTTVAQAYNPWTGTYAATQQAANPYSQWGHSVVSQGDNWLRTGHYVGSQGAAAGFATSTGAAGVVAKGPQHAGGAVKTSQGDLYVGVDGNLYKHTDSGWYNYQNGSWSQVQTPAASAQKTMPQTGAAAARQAPAATAAGPSDLPASMSSAARSGTGAAAGAPLASATPDGAASRALPSAPVREGLEVSSLAPGAGMGILSGGNALDNLQRERASRLQGESRTRQQALAQAETAGRQSSATKTSRMKKRKKPERSEVSLAEAGRAGDRSGAGRNGGNRNGGGRRFR